MQGSGCSSLQVSAVRRNGTLLFSCLLAMASGWITFQDDSSIHLLETVTAFRQLEEWMEHMPSEEFDYPHHIAYWKLVINVWKSKLVWEESYCCRWQFAKTRILSREFRQKEQKENMQDRLCCLSTIFLNKHWLSKSMTKNQFVVMIILVRTGSGWASKKRLALIHGWLIMLWWRCSQWLCFLTGISYLWR